MQKALVDAGEQVTREGCKRFEDGEKAATEKIKSQGMKIINFSDEDKKQFDVAFKAVAEDWVKDINKRGKPGTEVFKAFTDAARRSNEVTSAVTVGDARESPRTSPRGGNCVGCGGSSSDATAARCGDRTPPPPESCR